jgi:hypothetical protein
MPLERVDAHRNDSDPDRRPWPSGNTAIAVPAPGDRLDAAGLRRLSGAAGNQAVVGLLQGSRRVQRALNIGDLSSKTAAKQVLEPKNPEQLQAGSTFAINATFEEPTRQWIQAFCRANGNGNRFSETFAVTFPAGSMKVKSVSREKQAGDAQLAIEVDLRGAAHGNVPTPHFKIWSKFGSDKTLMRPWPTKVFPLSEAQVRTILDKNSLESLKSAWTTHAQKYYTFKNYAEDYDPS